MKSKMVRLSPLAVAVAFALSGCGGGGGGGGSAFVNPYLRAEVPYSTPVKQVTIDPLVNDSHTWATVETYTADITGSGLDVIIAGRSSDNHNLGSHAMNRISLLSWQGGSLVDKTAQWFPGGINEIRGTEPSVKFADFFHTGRTDMFVAPSTDAALYGPAYLFNNNGSSFSRTSITVGDIWSHDSAIADLDGDGYKDIVLTDYGPKTTIAINNRVNNFTVYTDSRGTNGDLRWGSSSVAVADFLQNGNRQLIVTDNSCNAGVVGCGSSSTKMYSWAINGSNELNFTYVKDLPTPRFDLAKWAATVGANGGGHNVRAIAYDFNNDSVPDTIIFSRPSSVSLKYSEIQFLLNSGGNFTDVTDNILVGYDTNTHSTYNPKFIDLNGDGRTDILVSGVDFTGNNTSTQFLLKSSDGKYVAAHQNVLTDFSTQVNSAQGTENKGNTVDVFRAPDGKLYLMSAVSFMNGTDRQLAVYMSSLGSQVTTTAQTAINLIQQKWPYMTVPQANDVLARTSATYFGGRVIDLEAALNPVGVLSISTKSSRMPINGYISGVNFNDGNALILDELNRPFTANLSPMHVNRLNGFNVNTHQIDQHGLTSHAEYMVNNRIFNLEGLRIGYDATFLGEAQSSGQSRQQYTIGIPNIFKIGNWSYGAQYTSLNTNPWIAFGGAWGSVTGSQTFDNVISYRDGGFSATASLMHVSTQITPGLITRVNNMTGVWAESGYRFNQNPEAVKKYGDLGIYAGIKPMVLSGSVEANIPTAFDNQGNLIYTNKKFDIQNQNVGYIRALYSKEVTKNSELRLNGMMTTEGDYRVMGEFRMITW